MKDTLRIGTRGSKLALWQAGYIKSRLQQRYPHLSPQLEVIKTTGDKILDTPLAQVGGKGLFVKEIEEALQNGRVDLAVHSIKDVPAVIPAGLQIGIITCRENPGDVLISRDGSLLKDLPPGARLGTSSLRRQCQLLHCRPDIRVISLRGNLDTRIKKLETEKFDAVVVAAAGVIRLGLADRITEHLASSVILPAIGQGALGIETRSDDAETNELLSFLHDPNTACAVTAERAFLKRLEGGCQVPIAALGTIVQDTLTLEGLVGSLDGRLIVRDKIGGTVDNPENIGVALAERLLDAGARAILYDIFQNEPEDQAR